jgi:prevent-host-death family protein
MSQVSATEARNTLPDVLDRVARGEEVTITRHGRPVAVVVRPDALRPRRATEAWARAADIRSLLDEGRRTPLSSAGAVGETRADELIAEVRAGRKRR